MLNHNATATLEESSCPQDKMQNSLKNFQDKHHNVMGSSMAHFLYLKQIWLKSHSFCIIVLATKKSKHTDALKIIKIIGFMSLSRSILKINGFILSLLPIITLSFKLNQSTSLCVILLTLILANQC